jgi:hypothetical protein
MFAGKLLLAGFSQPIAQWPARVPLSKRVRVAGHLAVGG